MADAAYKRNWLIPVLVGVLLLVLSLIALFREPLALDLDTPEGTVQAFLQAIADEDFQTAHGLLSAELREECSVTDLASDPESESFSATLGSVEEVGDVVRVEVTIRYPGSGGLGSGYSFTPGRYSLEREDGAWAITDVVWPYFYHQCSV